MSKSRSLTATMSTFEKIPSTTALTSSALSLPPRSSTNSPTSQSPRSSPPPSEAADLWTFRDTPRAPRVEESGLRERRLRRVWAFGSLALGLLVGIFFTLAIVTAGDLDHYANGGASDRPWLLAVSAVGAGLRSAMGRPVRASTLRQPAVYEMTPAYGQPPVSKTTPTSVPKVEEPVDSRRLHLLIPLNAAAHEKHQRHTCRLLLSALVNGYEPTIINWSSNATDEMRLHREKLSAVAQWLDETSRIGRYRPNRPRDGDLVAMFDSLDVWLQLPPSWLKARYDELISGHRRRVDAGLSRGHAPRDVEIVVGADKVCWPQIAVDAKPCTIAPDSPVPKGVMGRLRALGTGVKAEDNQPTWVNSGAIVGTVRAMRPLFQTLREWESTAKSGGDQYIFNELLAKPDTPFILDHWNRIFHVSNLNWKSMAWVAQPSPHSPALNPSELASNRDGNAIALHRAALEDAYNPPWKMFPTLMQHASTAQVPVAIHLNDPGMKQMRDNEWKHLWFSSKDDRFKEIVDERLLGNHNIRFSDDGSEATFGEMCSMDHSML